MANLGRIRFSIDIVGEHAMDAAIGVQAALRRAAVDAVGPSVRVDELPVHEHASGCEFCLESAANPAYLAHQLTDG